MKKKRTTVRKTKTATSRKAAVKKSHHKACGRASCRICSGR